MEKDYEENFCDDNYDYETDDNYDYENEDMTGCCEYAPRACYHCTNYGCNAHPCN